MEGVVPDFSKPISYSHSERRGRSCTVSHVNAGRSAYDSFMGRAIRLFNFFPQIYYMYHFLFCL